MRGLRLEQRRGEQQGLELAQGLSAGGQWHDGLRDTLARTAPGPQADPR
jgi:hypothetical protein